MNRPVNRNGKTTADVFLRAPLLNGWPLFWGVAGTLSVALALRMSGTPLQTPEGISAMIAYAVRWSVPWLFLAFAASSVQQLFPGAGSRWLLRNRRIFGLCFAAGMAWQASFIIWLVTVHREYYVTEVYVLRDAIEGVIGYALLIAMTATSFRKTRAWVTPKQWRTLHLVGIYFLWAYAFSTYWHELYYYPEPDGIDYVYYSAALLAWSLRLAAWTRQRRSVRGKSAATASDAATRDAAKVRAVAVFIGTPLIMFSLAAAFSGQLWMTPAYERLYGFALAQPLELYLPYWPFIPFLPLFAAALGAALLRYREQRSLAEG